MLANLTKIAVSVKLLHKMVDKFDKNISECHVISKNTKQIHCVKLVWTLLK